MLGVVLDIEVARLSVKLHNIECNCTNNLATSISLYPRLKLNFSRGEKSEDQELTNLTGNCTEVVYIEAKNITV